MATKNDKKLTSEEEAIIKVKNYIEIDESNIVAILYKKPELYHTYDNLKREDFIHNQWKVLFQIGYDIIITENKTTIDDIAIDLYLEKHTKLCQKYNEYGGWEKISTAMSFVKEKDIESYISEWNKWRTILSLSKYNFPISDKLSSYTDMPLSDIYNEYETFLNHIFIDAVDNGKVYNIADGIYDLIDELDEGLAVGLPLYNAPMLTHETGGNLEGNITLVGGLSGMGKSTLSRNLVLPSILEKGEKILIMINEEGKKKWQRELLIWVANNIFKEELQKYRLRDGKFSKELKDFLKNKCAKWIWDRKEQIILKPFDTYKTEEAIKYIKKYAHAGMKYFMLDTYKADSGADNSEAFWFNLQQNMVKIYDVIKEECLSVHIWITFQLAKSSSKQRCYTQENIGMAKNIIDVASTCIMVRKIFDDEYQGGKKELQVYKTAGKNGMTKIPVILKSDKKYQILFIVKNREGSCNEYSIVIEHDMSKNTFKEVGICVVPPDF